MKYQRKDLLADLHTHSTMSLHAYSTLKENLDYSSLPYLAITDHIQLFQDSTMQNNMDAYINNTFVVAEHEPRLIRGAEIDVDLDLERTIINWRKLQLRILSFHFNDPNGIHADKYIQKAESYHATILGHPYRYDVASPEKRKIWDEIVVYFAETGRVIELNETSLDNLNIPLLQSLNCSFSIGSDAHYCKAIGQVDKTIDFINTYLPNKHIVNFDKDWLEEVKHDKFVLDKLGYSLENWRELSQK